MTEREPVVCFGCYDYWHSNAGSPIQLMDAIHARGHRVLWINNIGMNMPRLRKAGLARRILLRLRSWSRWLRASRSDFYVLAPIILPLFGNKYVERINDFWLELQIRLAYRLLGFTRPLAIVCLPSFANAVERLPRSKLVYYYTDKYDAYRDIKDHTAIGNRDLSLFNAADLVLCASRPIFEPLADRRPGVHYFPHAVEFELFQAALASSAPIPDDLAAIPQPRIGYFGSLSDSNDQEMIRYAASADPALQFVLIGRALGDFSQVTRLPNVHLLGFKPFAEIPFYGKHFDVGFMNWKMTEWIRHCSPVKAKEYLALGLPIVSVPIEEVIREYGPLVEIASTGPEFLAAIYRALAADSSEQHQKRLDRVRNESWDTRASQLFAYLEEVRSDA